jgi:hypothetical protein
VGTISSRCRRSIEETKSSTKAPTEDGGLSGVVEADDDDAHLLGAEESLEQFAEYEAHFFSLIIIKMSNYNQVTNIP